MNAASTPILICLHGWGGSGASFNDLRTALAGKNVKILSPDLPGFGAEPEPKRPWTVDDYAIWAEEWVRSNGITEPIHLLGHSHGGRVAIKLASRGNIHLTHLYLCAAAGIPTGMSLKKSLGLILAKTGKAVVSLPGLQQLGAAGKKLLYRALRVHDYERASPVMRQTMLNVSNEDLRPLLPLLTVPTDIFWGTKDTMTPVRNGHQMHKLIRGSKLHLFPGAKHRIHRQHAADIAGIVMQRLSER